MRWAFWRSREPVEDRAATPTAEALREAGELQLLRPRVERAVRERNRLLAENNYTARIRALYQEGHAS